MRYSFSIPFPSFSPSGSSSGRRNSACGADLSCDMRRAMPRFLPQTCTTGFGKRLELLDADLRVDRSASFLPFSGKLQLLYFPFCLSLLQFPHTNSFLICVVLLFSACVRVESFRQANSTDERPISRNPTSLQHIAVD